MQGLFDVAQSFYKMRNMMLLSGAHSRGSILPCEARHKLGLSSWNQHGTASLRKTNRVHVDFDALTDR
jgi:hypothetical protein